MVRVTVVHAPAPREVHERELVLPAGATVADAVAQGELQVPAGGEVGVWGRRATPGQLLREGDRVEVCRPLLVDPKVARRERFQRQGARATGLFARRRPGGKQGY
jgi:putative ubiquitin-RnfH superfamily antitoxin RatB of RatAB toxin-antitoxin module